MRRDLAFGGPARLAAGRCARSLACLAFVFLIGAAFWLGVLWIGQALIAPLLGAF